MKGKISLIWRVVIATVLVVSLGLVMAAPVAADPEVSDVSVTVNPAVVSSEAEYTIEFTVNVGLEGGVNSIIITFPEDTTVPSPTIDKDEVWVTGTYGTSNPTANPTVTDRTVTIITPEDVEYLDTCTVVFEGPASPGAGIINPTEVGTYCLTVKTDEEPTPVEGCYNIGEVGPGPVDVYLKYQATIEECGYIYYVYVESFDDIQEALDFADDVLFAEPGWYLYTACPSIEEATCIGCKIKVHPGTYDETIVIDTPGVELVSVDGSDVTIIDAEGIEPVDEPAAVYISAGGVTFDGFTVKNAGVDVTPDGFSDYDGDGDADIKGIGIDMDSGKNYTYILDETGEPIDADAYAYYARVNILNNEVYGSTAHGIIAWEACVLVSGNNVHDNEYDGFLGLWVYNGVETIDPPAFTPNPEQPYACTEVNGNTFADNGDAADGRNELDPEFEYTSDNGIQIKYASWYPWWDEVENGTIYIVGNTISGSANAGIYLDDGNSDMFVIKFNHIENNDVFGISSHVTYPGGYIVCIYNDIEGNGVWGIKNWWPYDYGCDGYDYDYLIATMNYFGDLSGPSLGPAPVAHGYCQQSEALGMGDAVSHYVEYKWWLTSSFEDVQEDLTRYYGSDCYDSDFSFQRTPIVELETGWNTMSTPVALDERADQMGEICALGGWMQNYILGYSYDPTSGWQLIDSSFQLKPLEAVYVRMAGPDMLPILLRTTNYMPARDLEPGWNLVGPNFGFWSQGITDMYVEQALVSIAGSWGIAISPDLPGQEEAWVVTSTTFEEEYMYIGDGYWVFVTKPTTLAGFRMAPWYLQDWEMDILDCKLPPWWQY